MTRTTQQSVGPQRPANKATSVEARTPAEQTLIDSRIDYLQKETDFGQVLFRHLVGYGVVAADFDGNILAFNDGARQMFGYSPGDVVGKERIESLISPEFVQMGKLGAAIADVMAGGQFSSEESMLRRGGVHFPAHVTLVGTQDKDERVIGFVLIVEDISVRKETEERVVRLNNELERRVAERTIELEAANDLLMTSERRLRAVIESAIDGIALTNAKNGEFITANPALCHMLGYPVAGLIGLTLRDVMSPEAFARLKNEMNAHPAGEALLSNVAMRRRDGSHITADITTSLVEFGGRSYRINIARDISERAQFETALRRSMRSTISALAGTMELRDPFTAGHQRRVAALSVAIAKEMGLPKERIEGLDIAASIHDIGKVTVPQEFLSYPGPLTAVQYTLIQGHVEAGCRILKDIEFPWPIVAIVSQHHERLDGSGYPKGLKENDILPEGRILAVADVVEAMMSHRPYRPARGLDKALSEIEDGKGRLYDPKAVDACVRLFREKRFAFDK